MDFRQTLLPVLLAAGLAVNLLGADTATGQGPTPTPTPVRTAPPAPGITVIRYNTPTPPPSPTPSPTPTSTASPTPSPTRTPAPSPAPPASPTPRPEPRLAPQGYTSRLALPGFSLSAGADRLRSRFQPDLPGRILAVPFRSQLDGTVYAEANCGPASLAMVLEAFGLTPSIPELRALANRLQGTTAPDTGVWPRVLARIAALYGLKVAGPGADWSPDDVRAALDRREPVITVVKYRELPSNGRSIATTEHYIVVTGYQADRFFYNDPAFADDSGFGLVLTEPELRRAWAATSAPGTALAIGPGPGFRPVADLFPESAAPVNVPAGPPAPDEGLPATAGRAEPTGIPAAGAAEVELSPGRHPSGPAPWYAYLVAVPPALAYGAGVIWFGRRLSRNR